MPGETGKWVRAFTVVISYTNELVAELHDRMPVIVAKPDRKRWLSREEEPDDLLRPYPAELMTMWPVSTKGELAQE